MRTNLIFAIILFISFSLAAQEKGVQSFSLKEAVDYAVQNNITIKNAKLGEEKAKAFNWEILTQGLPQLNGSLEYDYYFKTPQVPAVNQYLNDTSSTFSKLVNHFAATDTVVRKLLTQSGGGFNNISFVLPHNITTNLQLTQLLWDARYMFGIKARKDLYKTSRLSREMSEFDIRYAVTKAYYQAEAAQEAKGLLKQNANLVDKLLNDTRKVYEQGLADEIDVDRLQLVRANLESQMNLQNQLSEVGLANLKFQMGMPLDATIILKDKLDDLKHTSDLAAETKFDPKNRIEYDLLNTAITLKGFDIAQKRSGYYPTILGFLNYGWDVQTNSFGDIFHSSSQLNANGTSSNVSPWYPQGIVGLSLKIPIFDSGLKYAQVKQAKIEQEKSRNDFENFKNGATLQYQVALSSFNSAVADEVNSQKTLDLSQKIYNKNQAKFKAGAGSSFELQQSEQEFTTNQLRYIQSLMNLLNAKADLDKAMGVK
jgi:outer membrane protein TolC